MTRVQLSLLAPGGVRIGAVPRIASPKARVQFPYSAPELRRCSQDSKASACKADHRECNSPRRLQNFEGSATLRCCALAKGSRANSAHSSLTRVFAGVAQWEERGPRKSVIGVRIAAPAPFIGGHSNVSLLCPREEFACDNASLRSPAGIAQREEQAHGKRPTAVRGCVPAPKLCWSSTVAVQRACTSPTSVRFTRPAPDLMAGLAEWLGAGLWLRSREFDSLISPQLGGSYKGIT